jgi:hypothetical protein
MDQPIADGVMESAIVGSPMRSCQALTGTWLVMSVDARSLRSSRTSRRSQILPLGARELRGAKVVNRRQIGLGQAGECARVGAVAARDVELVEGPRGADAVVRNLVALKHPSRSGGRARGYAQERPGRRRPGWHDCQVKS